MRLILLLLVLAAIGLAARHLLTAGVPPALPQTDRPAAPASREALQKFGQDLQTVTDEAAAERARRAEDATR